MVDTIWNNSDFSTRYFEAQAAHARYTEAMRTDDPDQSVLGAAARHANILFSVWLEGFIAGQVAHALLEKERLSSLPAEPMTEAPANGEGVPMDTSEPPFSELNVKFNL